MTAADTTFLSRTGQALKKHKGTALGGAGGISITAVLLLVFPEWNKIQSALADAAKVPALERKLESLETELNAKNSAQWQAIGKNTETVHHLEIDIAVLKALQERKP